MKKQEKFEKLQQKFPSITKEFLEREYLFLEKSLPDFKKEYGLNYKDCQFLLDW